jgi:hypothetical protein
MTQVEESAISSNLCERLFCMQSVCDEDSCFQEGSKIL